MPAPFTALPHTELRKGINLPGVGHVIGKVVPWKGQQRVFGLFHGTPIIATPSEDTIQCDPLLTICTGLTTDSAARGRILEEADLEATNGSKLLFLDDAKQIIAAYYMDDDFAFFWEVAETVRDGCIYPAVNMLFTYTACNRVIWNIRQGAKLLFKHMANHGVV